eukprot:scaffold57111_cov31-Tisochrysis_lutea.AAC.3
MLALAAQARPPATSAGRNAGRGEREGRLHHRPAAPRSEPQGTPSPFPTSPRPVRPRKPSKKCKSARGFCKVLGRFEERGWNSSFNPVTTALQKKESAGRSRSRDAHSPLHRAAGGLPPRTPRPDAATQHMWVAGCRLRLRRP